LKIHAKKIFRGVINLLNFSITPPCDNKQNEQTPLRPRISRD
jgi:hypothetical protein